MGGEIIEGKENRKKKRTIFEANRNGKTRSELTMNLALSGACSNGTPRHQISHKLWADGVKVLHTTGHSKIVL